MRIARFTLMFVGLAVSPCALAQTPVAPRFEDLPKLAVTWPPAWSALVRAVVPPREDFERDVLDRIAAQLSAEKPTDETYRLVQTVLAATLRRHLSVRRAAPLADASTDALQKELQDQLIKQRVNWLHHLMATGENKEGLKLADQWLATATRGNPLRGAILQLWIQEAKTALAKNDYALARSWLNRIDASFTTAAAAEEVRKPLRERAQNLLKESEPQPDAAAIRSLQEALELWPRLPEARDALERRKGSLRTLRVAVRSLPEQLSPATAWSEIEKQSLGLLFDRLVAVEHSVSLGKRYVPLLTEALPTESSLTAHVALRRDAYWSSGERLTAADVRHTALLMSHSDGRWREVLEMPRFEGNAFHLSIGYRQGLFDALAPLDFFVLPQYYHGKQLDRADDAAFAKSPVGAGPFQYVGRKQDAGKMVALFQANPFDLRRDLGSLRELHMQVWNDLRKDLVKPLPHVAIDVPTDQITAFKDLGYTEATINDSPSVHFLAVNHRRSSLASAVMRRTLAHALDRQTLLDRHFRSIALKGKYHAALNGPFPHGSWASCPAPRVPEELYQPEQARSLARKLPKDSEKLAWTLKYADDDPRVKAASEDMAKAIRTVFLDAKINIEITPIGLPPHALHKALKERDYDLIYTSADHLDDPVRLSFFFDPHGDATRPGGSNFLGYDSDTELQRLLRACMQHRQFPALQVSMQAVHVHLYETMPLIPLWQLDRHVMVHSSLRVPALESRGLFAKVQEWRISQ